MRLRRHGRITIWPMARRISAELRQTIAGRANLLPEYCLIAETDTFYGCEVDHSRIKAAEVTILAEVFITEFLIRNGEHEILQRKVGAKLGSGYKAKRRDQVEQRSWR
jgi:hypothetical protein